MGKVGLNSFYSAHARFLHRYIYMYIHISLSLSLGFPKLPQKPPTSLGHAPHLTGVRVEEDFRGAGSHSDRGAISAQWLQALSPQGHLRHWR